MIHSDDGFASHVKMRRKQIKVERYVSFRWRHVFLVIDFHRWTPRFLRRKNHNPFPRILSIRSIPCGVFLPFDRTFCEHLNRGHMLPPFRLPTAAAAAAARMRAFGAWRIQCNARPWGESASADPCREKYRKTAISRSAHFRPFAVFDPFYFQNTNEPHLSFPHGPNARCKGSTEPSRA